MSVDEIFNGIPGSDYQVWLGGVRKTERDKTELAQYLVNRWGTYQRNVASSNRYLLLILSPVQVEQIYFREQKL
jgi:hypothetical protein